MDADAAAAAAADRLLSSSYLGVDLMILKFRYCAFIESDSVAQRVCRRFSAGSLRRPYEDADDNGHGGYPFLLQSPRDVREIGGSGSEVPAGARACQLDLATLPCPVATQDYRDYANAPLNGRPSLDNEGPRAINTGRANCCSTRYLDASVMVAHRGRPPHLSIRST